jgi:hypothetical protein
MCSPVLKDSLVNAFFCHQNTVIVGDKALKPVIFHFSLIKRILCEEGDEGLTYT